ncbi:MAG: serine hydrolase [Bacteroidota bacterium]
MLVVRTYLLLLLCCGLCCFGWGQSQVQKEYKEALESIVLLKNQDDLLPLHRLDTQRIAYLSLGLSQAQNAVLLPQLRKYTLVDSLPIFWQTDSLNALEGQAPNYNLLVITWGGEEVDAGALEELQALPSSIRVVSIGLGVDAFAKNVVRERSQALLLVPHWSSQSLSLAAQIPFGGQPAVGRLAHDLEVEEPYWVRGFGIQLSEQGRLGYVEPEVVGMDGQLLQDSIRAIVEEGLAAGAFPGAQVLVAKDGHIIYHQAFGYHTYEEKHAVRTDDLYDFASITKISTGLAALMKWSGEGRFDLDAPLKQYFPDFERSNKAELSFRSMLAHQAQLRPWIPYWQTTLRGHGRYPWEKDWESSRTNDFRFRKRTFRRDSSARYPVKITDGLWLHQDYKEKIYKAIEKSPLNEQSGYRYSGLLFYLLPDLVNQIAGVPIEDYLKGMFYKPLGAHTLTYNPTRFFPAQRIIPTERDTFFRMTQLQGTVHDEGAAMMGGISCNAGLFGTANDLAKLMQLYLNKGQYGGERYIPAAAVEVFTARHFAEADNHRGLGFDKPLLEYDAQKSSVAKSASAASFGHSGYTGTFAWADPEHDLLFIFLSNRVYPTRNNRKLYQLNIRPSIHQVLYDAQRDFRFSSLFSVH